MDDLHRFNFEGLATILRERPDESVQADVGFGPVECSDLNEDVLSVDGYLGMVSVDDGRH